eukprot:3203928-Amphidinium_carterae.1
MLRKQRDGPQQLWQSTASFRLKRFVLESSFLQGLVELDEAAIASALELSVKVDLKLDTSWSRVRARKSTQEAVCPSSQQDCQRQRSAHVVRNTLPNDNLRDKRCCVRASLLTSAQLK